MTDFISTTSGLRQLQGLRVYRQVPDTKSQCISFSRTERENMHTLTHTRQCVVLLCASAVWLRVLLFIV